MVQTRTQKIFFSQMTKRENALTVRVYRRPLLDNLFFEAQIVVAPVVRTRRMVFQRLRLVRC